MIPRVRNLILTVFITIRNAPRLDLRVKQPLRPFNANTPETIVLKASTRAVRFVRTEREAFGAALVFVVPDAFFAFAVFALD